MADIISWDKAIDRKVKSSDNKDLGEVDSITKDYIQAKEGTISKNNYYIPKYYLQGYDGDNLWVSLIKDEVKARFERRDPPDPSEFETPEYSQRKSAVIQQYPDFANTIPMHSSSTPAGTTTSQDMVGLPWEKVIDKKVKSSDNQDIGKVESISTYYTEVKDGRNHYYVAKHHIQGFDGHHLHASE